ncbi:MAG: Archaeal/vacuolar-type H+-ATPase subunit E [uncultured Acidilobus sp. OSP8]|nr:MAG: Archaeal/vacuolar-type H+-ATPase subunit E [uncultured Acidilobus sp. OSP8]
MKDMSISGEARKVADSVTKKALSQLESQLDEALSAALKLTDSSHKASSEKAVKAIEIKAEELRELLRSKAAEADLKVKLKEESIKAEATDKVMSEALRRLKLDRGEWYTKFLRRILDTLQDEAKSYGGFIIRGSAEDLNLLRDLIKGYSGLELSEEPVQVVGGVVAVSKDGSVRLDYTLDQLVKENYTYLRGLASRELFEVR